MSSVPLSTLTVPLLLNTTPAIQCGGPCIARLEERPEVVKECRAATVASRKVVVTLSVPQSVVVNLRVVIRLAVDSGVGPDDFPVVGQNEATKGIAAPGHDVEEAVAGHSHVAGHAAPAPGQRPRQDIRSGERTAIEIELAIGVYLNFPINGKGFPGREQSLCRGAAAGAKTRPAMVGLTLSVTL